MNGKDWRSEKKRMESSCREAWQGEEKDVGKKRRMEGRREGRRREEWGEEEEDGEDNIKEKGLKGEVCTVPGRRWEN